MPSQATRLENLPQYVFAVIGDQIRALQAQGADVIRLDIGSPDLPPPENVVEALARSSRDPSHHGYTGYRGTASFREAVAEHYQKRYGITLDPSKEVLPLIGSKEGIVNLSLAYLGPGDVSLVPDIGYPSYSMGARLAGGETYWLELDKNDGYKPKLETVPEGILESAKLLWVNYPNNPTGAVADISVFRQIIDFCVNHDILMISDNAYIDVTYDDYEACSALQAAPNRKNVVEFFSFSKSYNMAGWRLGAAVGDREVLDNLLQVKSNVDTGHFWGVYDAGIAALQTPRDWIHDRNEVYRKRRDRVLAVLPKIGLSAAVPKGAIYIWAAVTSNRIDPCTYTDQARAEAHVSFAPGEEYGPGGKDFVRISLAVADNRLAEALARLERWYSQK